MFDKVKRPTRVLVVDDNRDAATSLSFLLAAAGYEVETSFDGQTALATAEHFEPDACLLDINMPGLNGYELARLLRENHKTHVPVLATVTAYGDEAHLDRAAEAGFDLQFTKPADPEEIIQQIDWSLNRCQDGQVTHARP